jgi:hypothetical protein
LAHFIQTTHPSMYYSIPSWLEGTRCTLCTIHELVVLLARQLHARRVRKEKQAGAGPCPAFAFPSMAMDRINDWTGWLRFSSHGVFVRTCQQLLSLPSSGVRRCCNCNPGSTVTVSQCHLHSCSRDLTKVRSTPGNSDPSRPWRRGDDGWER